MKKQPPKQANENPRANRRVRNITPETAVAPEQARVSLILIAITAVLGLVGIILTAFLTYSSYTGEAGLCLSAVAGVEGAGDCNNVLATSWGSFLGIPTSIFGIIAYTAVVVLAGLIISNRYSTKFQQYNRLFQYALLVVTAAMALFSIYLTIGQLFVFSAGFCSVCLGSAILAILLLINTIVITQIERLNIRNVSILATATVAITVLFSYVLFPTPSVQDGRIVVPGVIGQATAPKGWDITTTSGDAELELVQHLASVNAVMYGAWWCPHCHTQKQLFGEEAFEDVIYIECEQGGLDPQPALCQSAGVAGYPTWVVNGVRYPGAQLLDNLALASGFDGNMGFLYTGENLTTSSN